MTGTTAATGAGAISQNRGSSNQKGNILMMKGSGPPQPASRQQHPSYMRQEMQDTTEGLAGRGEGAGELRNSRQGPIKANRAALGNQAAALNLQQVLQDRGTKFS